jgi:hypothetical protein
MGHWHTEPDSQNETMIHWFAYKQKYVGLHQERTREQYEKYGAPKKNIDMLLYPIENYGRVFSILNLWLFTGNPDYVGCYMVDFISADDAEPIPRMVIESQYREQLKQFVSANYKRQDFPQVLTDYVINKLNGEYYD